MDSNYLEMSHLLQKNEAEAIAAFDTRSSDRTLRGDIIPLELPNYVEPIVVQDLCTDISDDGQSVFYQKIVVQEIERTPEQAFLHSLLSKLKENPSLLSKLQNDPSFVTYAEDIVEGIKERNIPGNGATFVGLIDKLRAHEKDREAYRLSRYAHSILCDKSSGVCTNLDVCTRCLETCIGVPGDKPREFGFRVIQDFASHDKMKSEMDERTYIAVCNFYYKAIADSPWEEKDELRKKGISWAREFIADAKTYEGGYFWEVTFLLQKKQDRDEAENRLRSCIYNPPDPERDTSVMLRCPNCCVLYYERFLKRHGSYEERMEILKRGLRDSKTLNYEEQMRYFKEELQRLNSQCAEEEALTRIYPYKSQREEEELQSSYNSQSVTDSLMISKGRS